MPVRLTVESGLAEPRVCELDDHSSITLGRNRDCTIILQDRHASRRHARIYPVNRVWYISDQETTNGTRVDGVFVTGEVQMFDGQIISVGDIRIRFTSRAADEPDVPHVVAPPEKVDSDDATVFEADQLSALLRFMNNSLDEATPHDLVTLALQTVLHQTGAELAGFLSLDSANPELLVVLPTKAQVDRHLSHHLTQKVLREGRSVWLGAADASRLDCDSLSDIHDAICVPLFANPPASAAAGSGSQAIEAPFGALHVYKTNGSFSDRQVRFVHALAGRLSSTLHALRSRRALEADNSRLRVHAATPDDLIGSSAVIAQLRQQIQRLADGPCTVMVGGESGVGKELVALGLHRHSARHSGPLVTVNCAAIPENLAESELFGHMRGSFTNATRDHPGYFAQADMGTLFLDELGELSLDMQAKLLRAIESKSFRPVGSRADVRADVRVIVATNRDLEQEVRDGRFRRDLYYRLTSRIVVPPLRDRPEDVPELVAHFLRHLTSEYRRRVSLSESAMERLQSYHWPGNVRQLRSVLEGAVAQASEGGTIHARDLHQSDTLSGVVPDRPASLNLEDVEEWVIRHAMAQTNHVKAQAARILGINRDTLLQKLKKYGIEREE